LFTKNKYSSSKKFRSNFQISSIFTPFFAIAGSLLLIQTYAEEEKKPEEKTEEELVNEAGKYLPGLPEYTREEVSKHNTEETRIWVIFRSGVYDITDFISAHPGQDKILLASGSSVEPFWAMYSQHYHSTVVSILEEYRIGNLHPNEKIIPPESNNLYNFECERHPLLLIRSKKPFNAEVPPEILVENMVTPNGLFFVRNHLPVPSIDVKNYVLEITGETLKQPIKLTLEDLKTKFKKETIMATIQCAGNRRNDMSGIKEVKGGFWDTGAISNANWSGARLRDILIYAGVDPNDPRIEHIQMVGLDKDFEKSYGASIPIEDAMDPRRDVLVAYEMNGEDIPLDHGFPLRSIVPGVVGARNVKWLHQIQASKEESPSHWQRKDYKGFSPNVDWNNVDWDSAPSIQEYPVQSAICTPKNGDKIAHGISEIPVKGYAWSGGGRGIIRVDVTIDGGNTWFTANLDKPDQKRNRVWAWTLWRVNIPIPKDYQGNLEIACRAVDSSYNTQPESAKSIWNLRGVLSNSWHHVKLDIRKEDDKKN